MQVKSKMDEFLQYLNEHFDYEYDKDMYGSRDCWRIMYQLPFKGDCEDYSLTYLYEAAGRSHAKVVWYLLTGKAKMCFCRFEGEGHAVLRWEGKYIDNIQKKFCTKEYMEHRSYVFDDSKYSTNRVIVKMIRGYLDARKRHLRG